MKYLFMLFLINNIYALGGNYVGTARLINDQINSSGSSGNTLGEDKIRNLRIGDYLQLDNKEQYILKTVSRHLLVDDFKLVGKYKLIKDLISEKIIELEQMGIEIDDTVDVSGELDISILPFDPKDFN